MPHKYYHGRTGRVWNITPRAIGVEIFKRVKQRRERKRLHVRVEHIRPSNSRKEFIERRKRNDDISRAVKEGGERKVLKRQAGVGHGGYFLNPKNLQTTDPSKYVYVI